MRATDTASHNDIVVAYLGEDDAHVLRVFHRPDPNATAELHKAAGRADPIPLTDADRILGVYVGLKRIGLPRRQS